MGAQTPEESHLRSDDLRLRPRARISAAVRTSPGFPDVEKELVAEAEVSEASSVRLTQLP